MHGFSYLAKNFAKVERIFWAVAVFASAVFATYICADSFVFWSRNPVINVVETYKYDTRLVPMPAIVLCPRQRYDELHHAAILLNRLQFRCLDMAGRNETNLRGLQECSESGAVAIRAPDSPFTEFLLELARLSDEAVKHIGLIEANRTVNVSLSCFFCLDGELDFISLSLQYRK